MAYGAYEDLPRRTGSNKVLFSKTFAIASNPKYDECQRGLASIVYKIFDKRSKDTNTHTRTGMVSKDQQLPNKLHKPINRKFIVDAKYSNLFEITFEVLILQTYS